MHIHTHMCYKSVDNFLIRLISEVVKLVKTVSIIDYKGCSLFGQVIGFNF